jgi:membrane associated rhomboid family serine protease
VLTGSRLPLTLAGATGAAAAVIGGYFVLYRRSKVVLLVPVGLSLRTIEVGAFVFAALWFVLQVVSGLASLRTLAASPVPGVIPSWAHVAGLAAGAVAVLIFRRPERERPDWWIERQRRRGG